MHDYWENHSFDEIDLCKVMSLLFNMLFRLVIAHIHIYLQNKKFFLPINSAVRIKSVNYIKYLKQRWWLSKCHVKCCSASKAMPGSLWPQELQHAWLPILHYLPDIAQTQVFEPVMPSNHLILCHPLLLLPSIFPSIRVFSNELALFIRWPKYWSFSFSISPSSEYSEFISFRIDWFNLFAVQGTLKSLLYHHNPKA